MTQKSAEDAMRYITNIAKKASDNVRPWCSKAVLDAAVATVQQLDVMIHFRPQRDLKFLARDGFYRSQHETGTTSIDEEENMDARRRMENK